MPRPRWPIGALAGGFFLLGCSINPPLRLGQLDGLSEAVELADVPFYDQQANHCGPASLLAVLEHSGVESNLEELVDRVYVPGLEGSLQAEMTATARGMGRVAYALPPEPGAIFAEVEAGRPVLVLLNLGVPSSPRWHYAVVVGFDAAANRVLLRSGHERRRVVKARRWLRRWDWAGRWALVLLRPGEWPARADRSRLLQALADFEEVAPPASVERAWSRALEAWPDEPVAWLGAGNTAYALGDTARAERAYREAVSLAPESLPARMNLALVLAATGRACDGRRQLGTPPPEDHPLTAAFDEQLEDLERKCSESGEDASCG